jgi:uncharacterized protein YyaL (SSP411 family)
MLNGKNVLILLQFLTLLVMSSCAENKSVNETIKTTPEHNNQLINESSPYLLQHAHNPVDWMPWGDEAFEKAEKEDKLVLVSIGYSACHWCHVMEHESFEDSVVANFMNENFVCIKVDREERPDVDQVYMTAVQLMTGSGGWPLNCFTLPDGRPIYGGTYFNKKDWLQILSDLSLTYQKDKARILKFADGLTKGVIESELIKTPKEQQEFKLEDLTLIVDFWKQSFDTQNGGMKRTPKFPLPNNYDFLMQHAILTNDTVVLNQIDLTLQKMAYGGIYDQIGGGFARYSTDQKWKVPHFEKMLYDNAQLVSLYSKAYQRTKNPLYKDVVYQTLNWVYTDMTTVNGSFYSALDADSDGEEGKYYVWTEKELKEILNDKELDLFKSYYEINVKGLWEGNYILLRKENTPLKLSKEIIAINKKLVKVRNERIKPGLDDKSLTTWNALMLEGYLDAYSVFGEKLFLQAALKNANWLTKHQIKKDGSVLHTYKNGESKIDGFLDDYAFTISAFLKLYENTFDEKWLNQAKLLTDYSINNFRDTTSGMFFYTSNNNKLITRKMEINDNVIPASNSQMAIDLYKLGVLLDNKEYKSISKKMLNNVYNDIQSYPSGYSNWAILALHMSTPYYEIAITGDNWQEKLKELNEHYIPNKVLMGGTKSELPLLEGKFIGETTIFVCQEGSCKMPVTEVDDAINQMK